MNTHADIIRRLGGPRRVAQRLGRDTSRVSHWAAEGIPPHAYWAVLQLAKDLGVPLSMRKLATTSPRYGDGGTGPHRITPASAAL